MFVAATNALKSFLKNINYSVTTALGVVVMLVLSECSSSIHSEESTPQLRDSMAVMKSYQVTTLVSDSGVTRYRVHAKQWLVYDKVKHPRWDFPCGIRLEQFDQNYQVHSEVTSRKAIYYINSEMWILSDSVRATNRDGEVFETDELTVIQDQDLIYTDKPVKITQKERIINGVGMRSNHQLTRYTIEKTQGVITLDEEETATDSI